MTAKSISAQQLQAQLSMTCLVLLQLAIARNRDRLLFRLASGQLASSQLASGQLASSQLASGQLASGQLASSQLASSQLASG